MKEHIKNSHSDKVSQKCDLCEKSFSTPTILQSHIRTIHEGIYDYKCKYCEKGFGLVGSLNWHIKTVHDKDKEDTNLTCNSCGEQFASRCVFTLMYIIINFSKEGTRSGLDNLGQGQDMR